MDGQMIERYSIESIHQILLSLVLMERTTQRTKRHQERGIIQDEDRHHSSHNLALGQTCFLSAVEDERKIVNVVLMCIAIVNMTTQRVIFAEPYDTHQHWVMHVSHISTANFTKRSLTVFPNFLFVPCHLTVGQCILTTAALEKAGVAPISTKCCLSYMPLKSPEIHISIRVFHRVEGC